MRLNDVHSHRHLHRTGSNRETDAASVNPTHRPGQLIDGRYRLRRIIGEGAMGVVWEAQPLGERHKVALKILSARAQSSAATARFEREAEAARRVEHPNVVRVVDVGLLSNGRPFLAMEHLDGETLEDVLARRGTLSLGEACAWLRPIASALDAVHAEGIVHRDVKPANIVCAARASEPRITLIDFGLAARPGWDRVTAPGAIPGTPAYLAPEVAAGRPTDARTDVYSLGCVLFRMLTGRLPHERKNILATLTAKLTEPAARLSDVSTEPFPDELEELLARTLAIDPDERPSSAGAFVREVVRIAEGRSEKPVPPLALPKARTAKRRSKVRMPVALLAATLGLAALFAWAAGAEPAHAGEPDPPGLFDP